MAHKYIPFLDTKSFIILECLKKNQVINKSQKIQDFEGN